MTEQQVKQLIDQLEARANKLYDAGQPDDGERYSSAAYKLEIWLKRGMAGAMPIAPADYGLEASSVVLDLNPVVGEEASSARPVSAPAKAAVPAASTDATGIGDLRQAARAAEARGDRAEADELWRKVLELDAKDDDARTALLRATVQAVNRPAQLKLADLRRKASSERIQELDEALQLARELRGMGLDEQALGQMEELSAKAANKRALLKKDAGDIETAAEAKRLRQAIEQLEAFIKVGRYEFEDRDGQIQPSAQVLARYNKEYETFCTQKAKEYLARAEKSLPTYPKAAVALIETALKEFDRADPTELDKLNQRIQELRDVVRRWDQAQALVKQAAEELDPEKRLGLLENASATYAEYEGIGELLSTARREAAGAIASDVKNIHDDARIHLSQGRLDEARTIALKARKRAAQVRTDSTDLKGQLERIDTLMADLAQAATVQRLVTEARISIDVLLAKQDFGSAFEALQKLPEEARQDYQIKVMEVTIARARGATTILNLAKRRFAGGDYVGVLDVLGKEGAENEAIQSEEKLQGLTREQRAELELLRRQATGRQAYREAVESEYEEPDTAEMLFELARLNEPELKAQIQTHLDAIGQRRAEAKAIKDRLGEADKLIENKHWAEAYALLDAAKSLPGGKSADLAVKWAQARALWRDDLLVQLKAVGSASGAAEQIIYTLRTGRPYAGQENKAPPQPLFDAREHQEQVDGAERALQREIALGATSRTPPQWDKAIAAWRRYLDLTPGDAEAQASLREALRKQALSDADRLAAGDDGRASALALLEERLKDPYLQGDVVFLGELVKRACVADDFVRAQSYLGLLSAAAPEGSSLATSRAQYLREAQAWSEAHKTAQSNFEQGNYTVAVRALDDLIAAYPTAENNATWRSVRDDSQRKAVRALIKQAREKESTASGLSRIEIISLYSQVIQLVGQGKNAEAEQGITKVQNELPTLLRAVVNEAEEFSSDSRDPFDALRDAERILGRLRDFQTATMFMDPIAERQRWQKNLEETARTLGNQRNQINKVVNLMSQARAALRKPDNDGVVVNLEAWLREAKRELPKAAGLIDLETDAKRVKDERAEIKRLLAVLRVETINEEDSSSFSKVQDAVRSIRQLDPDDRYQLQTPQTLDVYYDFLGQHVKTLAEHERLARERQENYRLFSDWHKKCRPQNEAFQVARAEVEDKRRTGSMEQQEEALDRALAVTRRAKEVYDARPNAEPQSFLADDIDKEIEGWKQEVETAINDLTERLARVSVDKAKRDELDARLTTLLGRKAVTTNQTQANRILADLGNLDPNWPLLAERQRRVQAWLLSPQGGLLGLLRGRQAPNSDRV